MARKTKDKAAEEILQNAEFIATDTENEKKGFKNCFVITPIGGENEPIRRHVDGVYDAAIVPVLEQFNCKPEIPHRMSMPGSINKQIIQKIYESDLVIANLTNINPNVMYELALRHCFNKPAIIISEEGTSLPFDINNERTIFYINDAQGIIDLKKKLKKAIDEIQAEKYSSPVVSVLGELKFEEQILNESYDTKEDNYSNSLQIILKRLDRIASDTRTLVTDERGYDSRFSDRIYRIISDNDSSRSLKSYINMFYDSLEAMDIKFKPRMIDDDVCEIEFYHLSPREMDYVSTEISTFCSAFDLIFIRMS